MKSPYRVLYSNDTTNIETCVSPYHRRGEPFRENMLDATVDETAGIGIDVHMLQPGVGWVPWWNSRVSPFAEQIAFAAQYGERPEDNGYAQYLANGGDMVKAFVARCRKKGLTPFVSLRLNDCHGHEALNLFSREKKKVGAWAWCSLVPILADHPDWRIGGEISDDWNYRALNWAIPEVRQYRFALINELAEQYDIDGIELDFMRHCSFFDVTKTPPEERVRIMTEFVASVRAVLDRTAKAGRRRWLCVRVPCFLSEHERLGIDLKEMTAAGVDMVNLSAYYFTEQQTDMAVIRRMIPDSSVYLEMCHCTQAGPFGEKGEYDEFLFRPTTPEQYETTAHLAYSRGLDGVSAFNFVYYREHGLHVEKRGPFREPPFEVFAHLGDPEWLAQRPQHYLLGHTWNHVWSFERPMPRDLATGQTTEFILDMAPLANGWKTGGKLRIQARRELGESRWTATINGVELPESENRGEPYDAPYSPIFGTPEQYRAWKVPPEILHDGDNVVGVTLHRGEPAQIVFLDLAVK